MIYTCKQCGREFKDKPSAKRIYCSKECHDIAQTIGPEVECEICGKKYRISPSKAKWKRNFCGNECRLKWLSEHTKEEINIPGHSKGHKAPHLTKLNKKRNPLLAPEPDPEKRGKYNFEEMRKVAEKKIGRPLKSSEDVHHINGIHSDNRPENLMVLDHREHLKLHWELAKSRMSAEGVM